MQAILTKVLEIAPSDARVVILGETGTGKGLLARRWAFDDGVETRRDSLLIRLDR